MNVVTALPSPFQRYFRHLLEQHCFLLCKNTLALAGVVQVVGALSSKQEAAAGFLVRAHTKVASLIPGPVGSAVRFPVRCL